MELSSRTGGLRAVGLLAAALAVGTVCLVVYQGGEGHVELLDGASGLKLDPIDDAIATGDELTVSGPDGQGDGAHVTLSGIKQKLARETKLFDDDKLSEAELAGRLSREIDRHEKCRRHWPHLQKLEAAQEIRVHDARNNLEVANRAMERARKELKDAEGLVMAARQEHEQYESERTSFSEFQEKYQAQTHSFRQQEKNLQLYQQKKELASSALTAQQDRLRELQAEKHQLELKAWDEKAEQRKDIQLLQEGPVALAPQKINIVHGQELAQVSSKPKPSKAVLSTVRHGVAVPEDASSELHDSTELSDRESPAAALMRLRAKSQALSQKEVKSFAKLPAEESKVSELKQDLLKDHEKLSLAHTKELMAHDNYEKASQHATTMKQLKLANDKLKLAEVNTQIFAARTQKDQKELAKLKLEEQNGPKYSQQLSAVRHQMKQLKALEANRQALQGSGVKLSELPRKYGARGRSHGSRETQLSEVKKVAPKQKAPQTKSQLEQALSLSQSKYRQIQKKLLAVKARLSAQAQEVGVHDQQLKLKEHDVHRTYHLLRSKDKLPTQALFNTYEDKLRALREERKKADGLLAKAERMLNIARIDSLHAAKTKKAALEELKYATDKLRRYQHLRSMSQHCQMDAWSEIRRLTHNAREKKLLAESDQNKIEALKQVLGDARTQDLAQE